MSASQTLDYDYPYSLVPGQSMKLTLHAKRWVLGPTTFPGEGVYTHPVSALARRIDLSLRFASGSGMLFADTVDATNL
jgi:hypothetical protein